MREIVGKTALITGAGSGLGRALSLALAREGADLFLLDIDEGDLAGVVTEAKQYGVKTRARFCDLTVPGQIGKVISEIRDGVDILVNNAGVCFYDHLSTRVAGT